MNGLKDIVKHIPDYDLKLPEIEHQLMYTSLTTEEKITYIRARALIAQFLHIKETAKEFFQAIRTIHNLNHKIEEGRNVQGKQENG